MNIHDEIITRLNSKVRIRSLFSDTSIKEMKTVIEHMSAVLEDKLKAKEKEKGKIKAKKRIIMKIRQTMKDHDLSLADINELDNTVPSKKTREKHTFEYITLSGDNILWYGSMAGRLPKAFQDYLDRTGKKRADCIVKSIAEQP